MSVNDLDRQCQDALGVRGWPLVINELLLLTLLLTKRQIAFDVVQLEQENVDVGILMTGIYYYTCDKSGVYKRMTRHNEDSFVVAFSIIICKNLTITHGFGCRQGIPLK